MKILAYTSPARGHLYPLVPVLDELARRGHTIAMRTLSSQVGLMTDRGFDAAPISPAIEAIEPDDYLGRTQLAKLNRSMNTFGARSGHEVEDLRAAITEHQPDALLIDCMTWGATAAAEAWRGPWAQWFPFPLPLPSRDVPPFGPGFKPAAGVPGRLRDRLLGPIIAGGYQRAALPRVNATRRAVGVRPLASAEELLTVAPLLLYMTAEPFEYARSSWPPSVRMIGPCAWDPPADPPPWLDGIQRPLILVSTSSEFQDDGRLALTALEAFAGEDVDVIATFPSGQLPETLPPNAHVEHFVPHGPILERAVCAITHGGAGATQKALAAGVPVCVVPFGRDQLEIARRVEVAGAGTRLPLGRLNAGRLRASVRGAMAKRDGARRVADGYRATGGTVTAADAFEVLTAAWPPTPVS